MRNRSWQDTPIVTYALLAVTVAMFILETVVGGSQNPWVLLELGARSNQLIMAGQWWRLITPVFLHIGLAHIVINGFSLYYLGMICERIFGHWRFAVIYLVSALTGNVASFVFSSSALSAGASTAIFGLMGAFLMLGDTFRHNPVISQLARQFALLAGMNLIFNLFAPGIDIAGHIGGLVGGFLIAGLVGAPQLGKTSLARRTVMGVVLVAAVVALMAMRMTGQVG
ncbi:rhomboid family intramembrane serine protease [Lacticaseibacillus sp. GG6-2]